MKRGTSRRERLELTAVALTAAALGAVGPGAALAGRAWVLAPLVALPVGLWLSRVWRQVGGVDLAHGLERAFGRRGGKCVQALYLVWALVLLAHSAGRFARRVGVFFEGDSSRWLFLAVGLVVALWLGRDSAPFARTGRLFFLAVAATVIFALALAAPGASLELLWPPKAEDWTGLPAAAALVLSLAGYGVYALCLPRRQEPEPKGWPWAAWGCGALTVALAMVLGTLGPTLTGRVEEPFLLLLEGVQVPGAFRRGEAMLSAVLTLGDLVLLALLCYGCTGLWRSLAPKAPWLGAVCCAGAFALAGWDGLQELMQPWLLVIPGGNLAAGTALPALTLGVTKMRIKKK